MNKPKIRCYFNPTDSDGYYSIQFVGEGDPPEVPAGLTWYRLMCFMPWRLVMEHRHTKRLDEVFEVGKPLNQQLGTMSN